jgi:hypothetical protein
MDGRVGLLAKCSESDNFDNNLGLNPQCNNVNRAMIDSKKNSGGGLGSPNENIFLGY